MLYDWVDCFGIFKVCSHGYPESNLDALYFYSDSPVIFEISSHQN